MIFLDKKERLTSPQQAAGKLFVREVTENIEYDEFVLLDPQHVKLFSSTIADQSECERQGEVIRDKNSQTVFFSAPWLRQHAVHQRRLTVLLPVDQREGFLEPGCK